MKVSELTKEELENIFTKEPTERGLVFNMGTVNALLNGNDKFDLYAVKYKLFECENYPTNIGNRIIYLELREGRQGKRWVIFMDGWCLGKDMEFHRERQPSSRTDEFLQNTRFESKNNALLALRSHLNQLGSEQAILCF